MAWGCQKQDLQVPNYNPVFEVSFELDQGQNILWSAGKDHFILSPQVVNENGINIFRSNLSKTSDSQQLEQFTCDLMLSPGVSLSQLVQSQMFFVHDKLKTLDNSLDLKTESSQLVKHRIQLNSNTPIDDIPQFHFAQHSIDTLKLNFTLGNIGIVRTEQILHPSMPASYEIEMTLLHQNNQHFIEVACYENNNCRIHWEDGYSGGSRLVESFKNHRFRISSPDWGIANVEFFLVSMEEESTSRISFQNKREPIIPIQFCDLLYVDAEGKRYRSRNTPQDDNCFFIIREAIPYEDSPNGTPTQKLSGNFEAILSDSDGNRIRLKNASFTMAFPFAP